MTTTASLRVTDAGVTGYTYVLDEPLRLLVVDDDPIQREFASVYLATPAAEIVTVPSAEHALIRLGNEHFDLVMIDFEMPGMNGIELIHKIRSSESIKDLPVIMVTSHEDVETIDAAYLAGATSFVTKPVNWRLLSYQIKYVLRAHALQRRQTGHV